MTYKSDLVAAPSPRGTNRAGMFVPRAWFPRGVAYDARRGLGYDAPMQPSKAAQVARMLTDILSQDELAELGHAVCSAETPSMAPLRTRRPLRALIRMPHGRASMGRLEESAVDSGCKAPSCRAGCRFGAVLKDAFAACGGIRCSRVGAKCCDAAALALAQTFSWFREDRRPSHGIRPRVTARQSPRIRRGSSRSPSVIPALARSDSRRESS